MEGLRKMQIKRGNRAKVKRIYPFMCTLLVQHWWGIPIVFRAFWLKLIALSINAIVYFLVELFYMCVISYKAT